MENILLTGGSGTIGTAIIAELIDDYEIFNLDNEKLDINLVGKNGNRVHEINVDVTDAEHLVELRDNGTIPDTINHIITVAGGMLPAEWNDFMNVSLETYEKSVDVNLFGHLNIIHTFFPCLAKATGKKSVTMIGSINGKATFSGVGYSASKAGLKGLMMALAPQLQSIRTRINIVSPGTTVTKLTLSESRKDWSKLRRRLLTEDFTSPEDIASLVHCVMLNDSIEAQDLIIDSGQLASSN